MGAQFTIPLQTVIPGQLIASSLWNNEWQNLDTNFIPAGMDSYSDTDAQMQIQTNPFPGSVTSHATSLGGEIERIRFQISAILGTTYWYELPNSDIATMNDSLIPVGGVIDYPSATAPSANFHLADGTAINRGLFPELFALIGETFGPGDHSTTFNLPNYTDRLSIAAGNLYAVATTGGSLAGALTANVTDPGHNHTQNAHTHTLANHTHTTPAHVHTLATTGAVVNSKSTATPVNVTNADPTGQLFVDAAAATSVLRITATTNSGGNGTSGVPSSNTSDATTPTNNANTTGIIVTGTAATLPPYLGMYKMIRVI